MDARQQMMWEVCFPRKRIQEKEISNFDLAQAMRSEGHCFRCNPYLFPCFACLLLCSPFEWIGSAAPPIEASDAGLELSPRFPYFNWKGGIAHLIAVSSVTVFPSRMHFLLAFILIKYQIEETISQEFTDAFFSSCSRIIRIPLHPSIPQKRWSSSSLARWRWIGSGESGYQKSISFSGIEERSGMIRPKWLVKS